MNRSSMSVVERLRSLRLLLPRPPQPPLPLLLTCPPHPLVQGRDALDEFPMFVTIYNIAFRFSHPLNQPHQSPFPSA